MYSLATVPGNPIVPGIDVGFFLDSIVEFFTKMIKDNLQDACTKMYLNIFMQANDATENAALQVVVTPENMFPSVYNIVVNIAETVFLPIGALLLVWIMCHEVVTMITESNRMKEFGPYDVYALILKIVLGVLLLTQAVPITNAMFKIGQWAVETAAIESVNASLGDGFDAVSVIEGVDNILSLIGYLIGGIFVKLGVFIFSIVIKIAVWLRFIELYMFLVSAPIPYATFFNKDWNQVGYNYIRKILSLAFQPVYMILCFSIFTGTLVLEPDTNITWIIVKSLAAMFLLTIALFKTGTIADSIFNAH